MRAAGTSGAQHAWTLPHTPKGADLCVSPVSHQFPWFLPTSPRWERPLRAGAPGETRSFPGGLSRSAHGSHPSPCPRGVPRTHTHSAALTDPGLGLTQGSPPPPVSAGPPGSLMFRAPSPGATRAVDTCPLGPGKSSNNRLLPMFCFLSQHW